MESTNRSITLQMCRFIHAFWLYVKLNKTRIERHTCSRLSPCSNRTLWFVWVNALTVWLVSTTGLAPCPCVGKFPSNLLHCTFRRIHIRSNTHNGHTTGDNRNFDPMNKKFMHRTKFKNILPGKLDHWKAWQPRTRVRVQYWKLSAAWWPE